MADVVVNIRGNADQLRRELDDISRGNAGSNNTGGNPGGSGNGSTTSPSGSGSGYAPGRSPDASRPDPLPPSDRMIEDIRRAISSQGAVLVPGSANFKTLLNQTADNQRGRINAELDAKYSDRRSDLATRRDSAYGQIDTDIADQRASSLANMGAGANDPMRRRILEMQLSDEEDRRYRQTGRQFDAEDENLTAEETQERANAETELINAIQELTDEFENGGGGGSPDSYMNNLRQQRQQLIIDRDSAADEEGAVEAQKRIAEIDEKLNRVAGGGEPQMGGMRMAAGISGTMGLMNSLNSGDVGGTIMGAGGMAMMINPVVGAVIAAMGGAAKIITSAGEKTNTIAELSRLGIGGNGMNSTNFITDTVSGTRNKQGGTIYDYGFDLESFSSYASQYIKKSGSKEDWFENSLSSRGLETSLGLDKNALLGGSQYDRYGQSVNDAVSKLVTVLSSTEGSGVTLDDFSRVQEKFDIQQQIMGSYMGRNDKPDYDNANRLLAGFSSVEGITQDSRMGSDIQKFQNMVQNPMNDQMSALVNSTISDLYPETGGNMAAIDRKRKDSANEPEILQAVIQRIISQFGDPKENGMGYHAFQTLLPGIAPERMDAYSTAAMNGTLAKDKSLFTGDELKGVAGANKTVWETRSLDLLSQMVKFQKELSDIFVSGAVSTGLRRPEPNQTSK